MDGQSRGRQDIRLQRRHQVTTLTDPQGSSPTVTFTYDATGNRTQQTVGAQTNTYLYDARNQLRQIIQDGVLVGRFPVRLARVARTQNHSHRETVRYVYDGLAPLLVTDDTGTLQSRYTYGVLATCWRIEEPTGRPAVCPGGCPGQCDGLAAGQMAASRLATSMTPGASTRPPLVIVPIAWALPAMNTTRRVACIMPRHGIMIPALAHFSHPTRSSGNQWIRCGSIHTCMP